MIEWIPIFSHGVPVDLIMKLLFGIGAVAALVLGTITAVVIAGFTKTWNSGIWLLSIWLLSIFTWAVILYLLFWIYDYLYVTYVRAW